MATSKFDFDDLLRMGSRPELQAALSQWPVALTRPQAQRLWAHAAGLAPALLPLRLGIVHTYTSDLLEPWLALHAALEGLELSVYHAPYGLVLQQAEPGSALIAHRPDITLLMLRREDLHPDLARPIVGLGGQRLAELRGHCLARVSEILGSFRAHGVGQLLLTLLPSSMPASLGLYDAQAESSESAWWASLQIEITAWMREHCPSSMLIDLDDILRQVGRSAFFDLRYWYSARFPFLSAAASEFARRVATVGVLLKMPRAKVLVLDADNTLWGGIVGEDGIDGIALSPEYPGNAYIDFQRRILDFQQRGLVLAMCSKNNAADVEQVLRVHRTRSCATNTSRRGV